MRLLLIAFIGLCLTSCGGGDHTQTKDELIEAFKQYEDSIKSDVSQISDVKKGVEYAEKCLEIAHKFPNDKDAPKYMDKAHMIFAGLNLHARSALIADSIIMVYPLYENRAMVLQSAATTYDMFLLPRKKDKVKKYYELLLKENPKMPAEQRKDFEYRLAHIDLTFEEMIELQESKKPA